MNDHANRTSCLDAETLAAFAEGKLTRQEIAPVLAHLRHCGDCMGELAALRPVRQELPFRAIAAAAAAVIVLASGGLLLRDRLHRDPIDRLIALAPRDARAIEPRLSHGFPWAPYRGPMRTGESERDSRRMKLVGMAGDLVESADTQKTAAAQHDAAIALLLIDDPTAAVSRLRQGVASSPSSAVAWSDLAAAEYSDATRNGRASLYPEALAATDRALRIDPSLREALFNRALVLERMGLAGPAREAWGRYLAVDATSQWAGEARLHLAQLGGRTATNQFEREQPRLERAANAGDQGSVDAIVRTFPQQSRTWAEAEYLGRWGAAAQRGDVAAAAHEIAVARSIGDALRRLSGERLLADAVAAIDGSDDARRATLANAHVLYRKGRIAYSRRAVADAEPDLAAAASAFARGGSPMALVARYFFANARFDRDDVSGARAALEALKTEADAHPGYTALAGQIGWELALCGMSENDWDEVLAVASQASAAFARLGERSNLAMMEQYVAQSLAALGRLDDAWTARIRAFGLESAEAHGNRLAVAIGGASALEQRAGRTDAALSLLRIEQEIERAAHQNELLSASLVLSAIVNAEAGDEDAARTLVAEARSVAGSAADPSLRKRLLADAELAEGAAASKAQPQRSVESLTAAIDYYVANNQRLLLPESYLLRARALLRTGDKTSAERDLESGIEELERHPVSFASSISGSSVRDAGPSLFREAIRLRLDQGDVAGAFLLAERARASVAGQGAQRVTLAGLQQRLRGSRTAVLEIVTLDDELATIAVTESAAAATRSPVARGELARLAASDDEQASRRIYDLAIRPAEPVIAGAAHLIVINDAPLQNVSFAALDGGHGPLVQRFAISYASSATSLSAGGPRTPPRSVAAVAAASTGAAALPGASEELLDLRSVYARVTTLRAPTYSEFASAVSSSDVIHVAGHTDRQKGAGDVALAFADGKRMSWRSIAATPLHGRPLLVLAACETLRAPAASQSFSASLGEGFIAAGAGEVIGTLRPIADVEARQLFNDIHRQLAAGVEPDAALRQAQLTAAADGRERAWRAVALLTSRIPR